MGTFPCRWRQMIDLITDFESGEVGMNKLVKILREKGSLVQIFRPHGVELRFTLSRRAIGM